MFLKSKYRNRHKILKVLQQKQLSGFRPSEIGAEDIELSYPELERLAKLPEGKAKEQIDHLLLESEIYCTERNSSTYYVILQKGTVAYYDKKYIYNGKKEFLNDFYDVTKTISAILLSSMAIATFVINIVDTRNNKKDIEQIKMEIKAMDDSIKAKKH